MAKIAPVVSTGLPHLHVLFYNIKYIIKCHTVLITKHLSVLETALANKWLNQGH